MKIDVHCEIDDGSRSLCDSSKGAASAPRVPRDSFTYLMTRHRANDLCCDCRVRVEKLLEQELVMGQPEEVVQATDELRRLRIRRVIDDFFRDKPPGTTIERHAIDEYHRRLREVGQQSDKTSQPSARDMTGTDIYREGASIAFEVPLDQVTRQQRQIFKERFFLFTYSRGTNKENVRELVKAVAEMMRAQLRGP